MNKFLFVGAGVIGSVYAGKFAAAGHDVYVMDRGERLEAIRQDGIVLRHALTGKTERAAVTAVEELHKDDTYDLVVVAMRADQVEAVIPMLAANRESSNILFMVNNLDGYKPWTDPLGKGRVMIAFPGAAGTVAKDAVEYTIVSPLLQPTTFGLPETGALQWPKEFARLFRQAGFPSAVFRNMNAWQKYHVAWVTPLAIAVYQARRQDSNLADQPDLLRLAIRSIREGFRVLKHLGYPISPGKLKPSTTGVPRASTQTKRHTVEQSWTHCP